MASETFQILYDKAMARERSLFLRVRDMWHSMDMNDLPAAVRLARDCEDIQADFLDGIAPVGLQNGVDVHGKGAGCPNCGDPDCPGAHPGMVVMDIKLSADSENSIIDFLNKMFGPPQLPDEEGGN
jgi:hypothetical protein